MGWFFSKNDEISFDLGKIRPYDKYWKYSSELILSGKRTFRYEFFIITHPYFHLWVPWKYEFSEKSDFSKFVGTRSSYRDEFLRSKLMNWMYWQTRTQTLYTVLHPWHQHTQISLPHHPHSPQTSFFEVWWTNFRKRVNTNFFFQVNTNFFSTIELVFQFNIYLVLYFGVLLFMC